MSRNSQSERTKTAENSPGIIEDKPAALPDEIWEMIFSYTEYRDVFNLKIVSKHFHAMATRVANIKYKWYLLCQKKVPESQWCDILKLAQHPVNDNINCENFHAESEYPAIWEYLYSTWLEFSRFIDEEPDLEKFTGYRNSWGLVTVAGNIIAVYDNAPKPIYFYDILKPDAGPIYEIRCPNDLYDFVLSNRGNDLTLIRQLEPENAWIMEHWKVTSQELMHSERILSPGSLDNGLNLLRICESFGYLCLIHFCETRRRNMVNCTVEIRKAASTETLRSVRIRIERGYYNYGVEVHGDTLWILSYNEVINMYKISIRETQLKETCVIEMSRTDDMKFHIFPSSRPYFAVWNELNKITFLVSGRKRKTYDCTKDLKLKTPLGSIAYEGGILAFISADGKNIKMIKVNPDRLDSELKDMPSRTIRVNTPLEITHSHPWILNMGFTEYNSEVYFVVATLEELVVLKCRSMRG